LTGQVLIGSLTSRADRYSKKIRQPVRTWRDGRALPGTVTCTDVLRWTCCLLMACKRSGVRIPVAPPQFRQINSKSWAHGSRALYSSKIQQRSGTMCLSVGCDLVPAQGGIAGMTCWRRMPRRTQNALTRRNVPFPPLWPLHWCGCVVPFGGWLLPPSQWVRPALLSRAAVLPAGGLRRWRSIGAPGAPARWQGADAARRGATWRRWGGAAAAP